MMEARVAPADTRSYFADIVMASTAPPLPFTGPYDAFNENVGCHGIWNVIYSQGTKSNFL